MNILAIETSCDDTALSIVRCEGDLNNPSFEVLENIVSSQVNVHRPFGGVVPHLAKREHVKNLPLLAEQIRLMGTLIDAVAVTVGPGLSPALWAGITFASELASELGVELLGANHLEGHMYSILLPKKEESASFNFQDMFPSIGLIVSGGHTILVRMDSLSSWEKLGETRDDAVGEAFDKVAKMVGLHTLVGQR
ncbi:MAG: hypothetical protein R3B52_02910 [Candidatus Paceibacterota bacterium]